ncbi:conserved hypothetical protein [Gloeothece citriformis PCC 7424]|uniref:Uncharacterized protein n=1 Tax=Gloeothece citriformis (strain PCC 7424) TaxID=65393 RepID=B7KFQ5_GLOC7|nr:hypothetical protein [Gloeothece citriformis]ACK73380.1 conserved hypothetical protein [Gloeothece citriformis PCC 7424]
MTNPDPNFNKQVQRLHQLTVYGRWGFVILSWLSLGSFGIWGLREEFKLWQQYFTWTAVRYAIAYNFVPAVCLFFCIGITGAVLVWQSRNLFSGIPSEERQRLEQQVRKIKAIGKRHPLWKWVIK